MKDRGKHVYVSFRVENSVENNMCFECYVNFKSFFTLLINNLVPDQARQNVQVILKSQ